MISYFVLKLMNIMHYVNIFSSQWLFKLFRLFSLFSFTLNEIKIKYVLGFFQLDLQYRSLHHRRLQQPDNRLTLSSNMS